MNKEIIKDLINQGFTVQEALDLVKPVEEVKEASTEETKEDNIEETKEASTVSQDNNAFLEAISKLTESFNDKINELNNKLDTTIKTQQAINTKTSNITLNEKKAEDFLGQWLNEGYDINNENKEE